MINREQYAVAGLIGIVGLIVIYYLSQQKTEGTVLTPNGPTVSSNDPSDNIPSYPNSMPLPPLGDIVIGGSPVSLTYNQLPGGQNSIPTLSVTPTLANTGGNNPGCCKDCDSVGPASVMQISPALLSRAITNFRGWGGAPGAAAPIGNTQGRMVS